MKANIFLLWFDTSWARLESDICDDGSHFDEKVKTCLECPDYYRCTNSVKESCIEGEIVSDNQCITCPYSTYADNANNVCRKCPIGFECHDGIKFPCKETQFWKENKCHNCPEFHFCPSVISDPVPCTKYVLETAQCNFTTQIEDEIVYDFNKSRKRRFVEDVCASGQYPIAIGCTRCPAGTYGKDGISCVTCEAGSTSIAGSSVCDRCDDHQYISGGSCVSCLPNQIPNVDKTHCMYCPAGNICNTYSSTTPCPNGYYRSSLDQQDKCTECSAGSFCPSAEDTYLCPVGLFSASGATYCSPCPAGNACKNSEGSTTNDIARCDEGTYSSEGDAVCHDCEPGFFCPTIDQSIRIPCPDGTYQHLAKAITCILCPAGKSCIDKNTANHNNCPEEQYSLEGEMLCYNCPEGSMCENGEIKECEKGEFSDNGSCESCKRNFYCPTPNQILLCPPGRTPDYTSGSTGAFECKTCSAGMYCLGEHDPENCPVGSFCPEGTHRPNLCPIGTVRQNVGATKREECESCPAGFCCPMIGLSNPMTCSAGHFCPTGTRNCYQFPCPAGSVNPNTQSSSSSACEVCDAGKWCPAGSVTANPCPVSFFCGRGETDGYSKSCDAGYYVTTDGLKDTDYPAECTVCSKGYYCPKGSKHYPSNKMFPCPIGTYVLDVETSKGFDDIYQCEPCPGGSYCPDPAMVVPSLVNLETNYKCNQGHYCPTISVSPNEYPCPPGTYNNEMSKKAVEDCKPCPAGKFCTEGTGVSNEIGKPQMECNPGYYCPEGSTSGLMYPCSPGRYGHTGDLTKNEDCTVCPAGYYCTGGLQQPDGKCPPGYYCEKGKRESRETACPGGSYQPYFGMETSGDCRPCPLGNFCESGTDWPIKCPFGTYWNVGTNLAKKTDCISCPEGSFCGAGTINPSLCPAGFYSKSSWSSCEPCLAGYFCPSEGTSYTSMKNNPCDGGVNCEIGTVDQNESEPCPRGYICMEGVSDPIPCPPGTYNPSKGKGQLSDDAANGLTSDCLKCPAGYYCQEGSWYYSVNFLCDAGFYCPDNLINPYQYEGAVKGPNIIGSYGQRQIPCPEGTYVDSRGSEVIENCKPCEEGYYCPSGSLEMKTCPLGYYCPAETKASPEPCLVGTFGEKLNLIAAEDCTICTPGSYCNAVGLLQPRGPCDPGYVCYSGATTSSPDGTETNSLGEKTGEPCPSGGYCPAGSYKPWGCPMGTYSTTNGQIDQSDCTPCDRGYYCSEEGKNSVTAKCQSGCYCEGATEGVLRGSYYKCQEPCTEGHYCLEGSYEPVPCPEGTYQPQDHQSSCLPCPPGFTCPNTVTLVPTVCGAGYYCPSPADASEPDIGTLDPFGIPCPPGTYSTQDGIYAVGQCVSCPAGHYCNSAAMSKGGEPCAAGYICTGGSIISNPTEEGGYQCPRGHYCPSGATKELKCPIGTFNTRFGATSDSDCNPCSESFYCPDPGTIEPEQKCDDGYVCNLGVSRSDPRRGDDITNSDGYECPIGSKCINGVAEICPDGYFTDKLGQSQCYLCLDGAQCAGGTIEICSKGYYCIGPPSQTDSSFERTLCPVGTLGSIEGLSSLDYCTPCPAGKACDSLVDSDTESNLSMGYFSRSSATITTPTSENQCNPFSIDISAIVVPYEDARCGDCPLGFYCPENCIDPSPCQIGTYGSDIGGVDDSICLDCPEGHYCNKLAMTETDAPFCADGYYCDAGEVSPRPIGKSCPAGSFCKNGVAHPCPAGTFMNVKGASECIQTPLGYYQDQEGQTEPILCPAGKYCSTSGIDTDILDECPDGTYFAGTGLESAQNCILCPPGRFCSGTGQSSYTNVCDEGYKCPGGNTSPTENQCADGYYCPEGSHAEISCPGGKYCVEGQIIDSCDAGYFCLTGSTNPTDEPCPVGHYCGKATQIPKECPIGTYQPFEIKTSIDDCLPCPAGYFCEIDVVGFTLEEIKIEAKMCAASYYCPIGSVSKFGSSRADDSIKVCTAGSACPTSSAEPVECEIGYYQTETGQAECIACPPGYLCASFGLETPAICPRGSYCSSNNENLCPAGTYGHEEGLESQNDCHTCPPGYICSTSGLIVGDDVHCDAGYYCHSGTANDDDRLPCQPGHYCPSGSSYQVACEPGTYNSKTKSTSVADCSKCPSGTGCEGFGNTEFQSCKAGYYCPDGSRTTTEFSCPAGYYCLEQQADGEINPCPEGTWSNQLRLEESGQCSVCPVGFVCAEGSSEYADLEPCNLDGTISGSFSYCTSGTRTICPAGFMCDHKYSSDPIPCADGYYQDQEGQSNCKTCAADTICIFSELGTSSNNKDCQDGWICKEATVYNALPCSAGTYKDKITNTCIPCTEGYYCPTIGLSEANQEICNSGYYCEAGSVFGSPDKTCGSHNGDLCPIGSECSRGIAVPEECQAGTYAHIKGMDKCVKCPAGFQCSVDENLSDDSCSENHYCPKGSAPVPCSDGTYNPNTHGTSSRSCAKCLGGYYCKSGQGPSQCSEGTFCGTGSSAETPCSTGICAAGAVFEAICPQGKVCDGRTTTQVCPDGKYCTTSSDTSGTTVSDCPRGHYCNGDKVYPQPCPLGTYNNQLGESAIEACKECNNGYYCDKIGQTELDRKCKDGYDCQNGKNSQPNYKLCPIGSACTEGLVNMCSGVNQFQFKLGQTQCDECPDGFMCASDHIPEPCGIGSYCSKGISSKCPAGTYRDVTHGITESDCFQCNPGYACPAETVHQKPTLKCLAGYYCIKGAKVVEPEQDTYVNICPAGHYCAEGTTTGIFSPVPCPVGTFRVNTGGVDEDDCTPCSPGRQCLFEGLTDDGFVCEDGYICTESEKEDCPVGHYCASDRTDGSDSKPCPAGTWSDRYGLKSSNECYLCPEGYYCPTAGIPHINFDLLEPCPLGKYCTYGSEGGELCPSGFRCPFHSPIPMECPSNYYQDETGKEICVPCTAGYYCTFDTTGENYGDAIVRRATKRDCPLGCYCPQIDPSANTSNGTIPCPIGTFGENLNSVVESDCTACPEGYFCDKPGFVASNLNNNQRCSDGSRCIRGAVTKSPSAELYSCDTEPSWYSYDAGPCSAGSKCERGIESVCEEHTYSEGSSSVCYDCPAGFYCLENSTEAEVCPEGQYCPEGQGQTPCPKGTYNPYTGARTADDCISCPAGKYCPLDGQIDDANAVSCGAGYYCDGGDSTGTPNNKRCATGDYCPEGSKYKRPCNPGYECDGVNQVACTDGYECIVGNNKVGCPKGHSCSGQIFPVSCPRGYYQPNLRSTECQKCESMVCDMVGMTSVSEAGPCLDGFFCEKEAAAVDRTDYLACHKGHFCTNGKQTVCGDGTYQDSEASSSCLVCFPGFECTAEQASTVAVMCPAGSYCRRQNSDKEIVSFDQGVNYGILVYDGSIEITNINCPKGTFNDLSGSGDASHCIPCPAGYACDSKGISEPQRQCEAGYYCTFGASKTRPSEVNNTEQRAGPCPAGHYCPAGSSVPQKCPIGKFSRKTRLTDVLECDDCSAGYYCDTAGLSVFENECEPGFYCLEGQSHSFANPCPAGSYCPRGSREAKPCPTGTFSNSQYLQEESECSPCPMGYACAEKGLSVVTETCKEGYFCPGGSRKSNDKSCERNYFCPGSDSFSQQCKPGTYSSGTKSTECSTCQNGKLCDPRYQSFTTSNVSYVDCPAGFYCNYDDSATLLYNPMRCPIGTFNTDNGKGERADCIVCPPGQFCDGTLPWSEESKLCAGGFICETASFAEYPFDISDYSSCQGLDGLVTQSSICQPGSACPAGSTNTITVQCPIGHYTAVEMAAECLVCPPGHDCYETNIVDYTTYPCPEGYYCEDGVKIACDPGTYNSRKYASSRDDCLPCPGGFECTDLAKAEVTDDDLCEAGFYCLKGEGSIICSKGHFCPEGSIYKTKCPAGYNCAETRLISYSEFKCQEGYYCPPGTEGITSGDVRAKACSPGFYCPEGTSFEVPCPPGYLNINEGSISIDDCEICPYGYYCPGYGNSGPVSELLRCPDGFYCSEGTSDPSSNSCPRGYYCPGGSLLAPLPCAGEEGSAQNGKYQDGEGAFECKDCPDGYYCLDKDNSEYGVIFPYPCPHGYYCPSGTSDYEEYPCPEGTYGSTVGLTSVDSCTPCWGGYYCDSLGSINGKGATADDPDAEKFCEAGFYCPRGSTVSREEDCPVGFYCETGAAGPRPCPRGTSRSMPTQASARSDCTPCPSGYYCIFETIEIANELIYDIKEYACSPGYVCVRGAFSPIPVHYDNQGSEWKCNGGNTQNVDSCYDEVEVLWDNWESKEPDELVSGFPCQLGWACNRQSTKQEYKCPAGFYQALRAQVSCDPCPRGRLCDTEGLSTTKICPAGDYCVEGSSSTFESIPCPPGTYSDQEGIWSATHCRPCPAGHYCELKNSGAGAVEPSKCSAGFYCKLNAADDQSDDENGNQRCPQGFYCPEATLKPLPCRPGYYGSTTGLSKATNENDKNVDGCSPCRQGYFCPYWGMGSPIESGTVEHLILDSRFQCVGGFNCRGGERIVQDPIEAMCPQGSACDSKEAILCNKGQYQSAIGQPTCLTCPSGHYCSATSDTGVTEYSPCDIYSYCTEGSSTSKVCPAGTYSKYTGSGGDGRYNDCYQCPAQQYCDEGKIIADCGVGYICYTGASVSNPGQIGSGVGEPCPQGYYCTAGANDILVCSSSGEFIKDIVEPNKPGASDETSCSSCDKGEFCPIGATKVEECNVGGYCENGLHIACEIGYYNNQTGSTGSDDCVLCEPGWYCPDINQPTYYQYPAYPGYVIESEGAKTVGVQCPIGTYLPSDQSDDLGDCISCPAGYYCPEVNMTNPIGCEEGTFCPEPDYRNEELFPDRKYGNEKAILCPIYFYCEETINIKPCTAGYYCPEGSSYQRVCGDGLFCPENGLCPDFEGDGNLSVEKNGKSPCRCPLGYYEVPDSIRKSVNDTCAACPPGTYNNEDIRAEVCQPCTAGVICYSPAMTDDSESDLNNGNTHKCPDGYYCPTGSLEPVPCPAGTYFSSKSAGTTLIETCFPCPVQCNEYEDAFEMECDPDKFFGSFSNIIASRECTPCGPEAEQNLPGQDHCICKAKNRFFQAGDQSCPCRAGYEAQQTESGDCNRIIYELCNKEGYFRSVNGTCVTEEEMESYCRTDGCAEGTFNSFDTTLGICKCTGEPLDQNCNTKCRERNEKLLQINCPDPMTEDGVTVTIGGQDFPIDNIQGINAANIISDKSCSNSIAVSNPIYIVSSKADGFSGIYNPDPTAIESILFPVNTNRSKRQDGEYLFNPEFEIEQPITCFELNTIVIFMVSRSAFPQYDRDSLFNANEFDAAAFDGLADIVTDSPTPFFYRFYQPGVFSFKLSNMANEPVNRDLYVQVVEEQGRCFDTGPFFAAAPSSIIEIGITMPRTLLKEPDWVMIVTVLFTLIFGLLLAWIIYALSDRYGWSKTHYTDVDYHKKALNMNLHDYHSRATEVDQEVKTHWHGKRIEFEDLDSDINDDIVLDYKDQIKVEEFNAETLYQILEDEAESTKNLLAEQEDHSAQIYQQTHTEAESLKKIWMAKVSHLKGDTELTTDMVQQYKTEQAKIETEIERRKTIGKECYDKLRRQIFKGRKEIENFDATFDVIKSLVEEAMKLIVFESSEDNSLIRVRYAQLVALLSERLEEMKLQNKPIFRLFNVGSNSVFCRNELFSKGGTLLRPDIIDTDIETGLYIPKQSCVVLNVNDEQINVSSLGHLVISPTSGFVYKSFGSLLLDPGRLRVLTFDDASVATSDLWLIPFMTLDSVSYKAPVLASPSQFRFLKRVICPTTGLEVPILAAGFHNNQIVPIASSQMSDITGLMVPIEPFGLGLKHENEYDLIDDIIVNRNGVITTSREKLANHADYATSVTQYKLISVIDKLNMLGSLSFSNGNGNKSEIFTELTKAFSQFCTSVEKAKKFKKEKLALANEQLSCYDIVRKTGGTLGHMNYQTTGQLLPILSGWEVDTTNGKGKILSVYHNSEENIDIPLVVAGKEIGSDSRNKQGMEGKLVDLEWNRKEEKIEQVLQIGNVKTPSKDQYLNVFEVEYGERLKFIMKFSKYTDKIKVDLLDNYISFIEEIKTQSLSDEKSTDFSIFISHITVRLKTFMETEVKRRGAKRQTLSNGLPENIFRIFTENDSRDDYTVNKSLTALAKIEKNVAKYLEKYHEEQTRFSERMTEMEGSEDYNQKRILEMRHEDKKQRLFSEYFDQLKIKLHSAITSINTVQSSIIETRLNAEIAKMMIRGSFAVFSGVLNKLQLKSTVQENDQMKLLEKIRELIDLFESGKKIGLVPGEPDDMNNSALDTEVHMQDSDLSALARRNIMQNIESNKQSLRAAYEEIITGELDDVCLMFDKKMSSELNELNAELRLNRQSVKDHSALLGTYRSQSSDIKVTNNTAKDKAIDRTMSKYRKEMKDDINQMREKCKGELRDANLTEEDVGVIFADEELDEYLRGLLEEQQRRYYESMAYMSDETKIDPAEWEKMFREQVAFYFKDRGMSSDDLAEAINRRLTEAHATVETFTSATAQESQDKMDSVVCDAAQNLGQNIALDELRADYQASLDPNLSHAERDRIMKEFDENQDRLMRQKNSEKEMLAKAIKSRLALMKKLEASGLSDAGIEDAMNFYEDVLFDNLETITEEGDSEDAEFEKLVSSKVLEAEEKARVEASKKRLNPAEAAALIERMRKEEETRLRLENGTREDQRSALSVRLALKKTRAAKMAENDAEVKTLKLAEQLRLAEWNRDRLIMVKEEQGQLKAMSINGKLDPNDVFEVLGRRHAKETHYLKTTINAQKEINRQIKENEIIRQREADRSELIDKHELTDFDSETQFMLQDARKDTGMDLEAIKALSDLNGKQMAEIEDSLRIFNPEVADKIEHERELKKKDAEKDAIQHDLEKMIECRKQLEQQTQFELDEMIRKGDQKQKQRQDIQERRAELAAQKQLKEAKSDEEKNEILDELRRQKQRINNDFLRRKKAYDERLQERIKKRRLSAESEKAKMDENIKNIEEQLLQSAKELGTQQSYKAEPLKLAAHAFTYDQSDPLSLLNQLPVFQELKTLESNLTREKQHQKVLGAVDANFIDLKDAEYRNEGKLTVKKDLSPSTQTLFDFGTSLLSHLCSKLDLEEVKILAATSMPHNKMTHNAFRHSYYYDEPMKTVFIRESRFCSAGDLSLVLAHFVAHLRADSFDNDGDMEFLLYFFKAIKLVAEVTFKNTDKESARIQAGRDLIEARTVRPVRASYPAYMVTPALDLEERRTELKPHNLPISEPEIITDDQIKKLKIDQLIELESAYNIKFAKLSKTKSEKTSRNIELEKTIETYRKLIESIKDQIIKLT